MVLVAPLAQKKSGESRLGHQLRILQSRNSLQRAFCFNRAMDLLRHPTRNGGAKQSCSAR